MRTGPLTCAARLLESTRRVLTGAGTNGSAAGRGAHGDPHVEIASRESGTLQGDLGALFPDFLRVFQA